MMGLPGMHQDEVVAQGQQKLIQILPVAAGSFQPNADLCRDAVELGEGGGEACKARRGMRDREGGAHGGCVGAQDTDETGLAPHIDADDILERGAGASGGGRVSACHRAPPFLQGWSTTTCSRQQRRPTQTKAYVSSSGIGGLAPQQVPGELQQAVSTLAALVGERVVILSRSLCWKHGSGGATRAFPCCRPDHRTC